MVKIRVLVVDDQRMVRLSLGNFLRAFDDLEPIGAAANGREAVEMCARLHPDVVLMDIKMPDMDGIAATIMIHQNSPATHVILLTALPQQEVMEAAFRAGVSDYVLKSAGIKEIAQAIRKAMYGTAA
jgi:two-component system, NarL family, response regulator LiaR